MKREPNPWNPPGPAPPAPAASVAAQQFTPGPWDAGTGYDHLPDVREAATGAWLAAVCVRDQRDPDDDSPDWAAAYANARLMAAAPTLLGALIVVRQQLRNLVPGDDRSSRLELSRNRHIVDTAIAKATGGE